MTTAPPHGTHARYGITGCRCTPCRQGHAAYARRRHRAVGYGTWQGLVDPTGSSRRAQALIAIGYSCPEIARRLPGGTTKEMVQDLALGRRGRVTATTATAYTDLYNELCTSDGPSKRARNWAAAHGWHGPEAWTDETIDNPNAQPITEVAVDDVLVQRAVDGDPAAVAQLNHAERVEATRRLLRRGVTAGAITGRLGVSGQTGRKLVAAALEAVAA